MMLALSATRCPVMLVVSKARADRTRYTHTANLCSDLNRVGRDVTRCEGRYDSYEEGEDACARCTAGITRRCQGIVARPDTAHKLGTKLARFYMCRGLRVSQCARNEV